MEPCGALVLGGATAGAGGSGAGAAGGVAAGVTEPGTGLAAGAGAMGSGDWLGSADVGVSCVAFDGRAGVLARCSGESH